MNYAPNMMIMIGADCSLFLTIYYMLINFSMIMVSSLSTILNNACKKYIVEVQSSQERVCFYFS